MKNLYRVAALAASMGVGACTATHVQTSKTATISWTEPAKRVVLVEPDVRLGELEASGMIEWRADWSKIGTEFVEDDIRSSLSGRSIDLVESGDLTDPHAVQLSKLHDVVGGAILLHTMVGGPYKLPTKSDPLDFTLGPGVSVLRDKYDADYALFVTVRDSYSSAGRVLLQVGLAAFGVGIQGGQQAGYASLVDLHTGNVVWFNAIASGYGDLRTPKPAQAVVANLIKGLPL